MIKTRGFLLKNLLYSATIKPLVIFIFLQKLFGLTMIVPMKRCHSFLFQMYLGLIASFGVLSSMILMPELPQIGRDFPGLENFLGLTMSFFMIGAALGQLFWGSFSDLYGRQLPLYMGALISAVACLVCFFTTSFSVLLLARLAQGFGATSGNIISRALCRDLYTGSSFDRMIAFALTMTPLAGCVSLMFGYILGWRQSFFLGFILSVGLGGCTYYFLHKLTVQKSKLTFLTMIRESRLLLTSPPTVFALLSSLFVFASFFSYLTAAPLLAKVFFGLSGELLPISLFTFTFGTFLGGVYQSTWGWKLPWTRVGGGCWGLLFISLLLNGISLVLGCQSAVVYMGFMMILGGMCSIVNVLTSAALLRYHDQKIAGTLSSLIGFFQTLGSALGSFFATLYLSPSVTLALVVSFSSGAFMFYTLFRVYQARPVSAIGVSR
jgi:DHA1 family bicyclomycin/chloramphenicol resistance-like MFS transporter